MMPIFLSCCLLSSCETSNTEKKITKPCVPPDPLIKMAFIEESIIKEVARFRNLRLDYAALGKIKTEYINTNVFERCESRLSEALQLIFECKDDISDEKKRIHDLLHSDDINFGKAQHSK